MFQRIVTLLEENRSSGQAESMSAYMKNQFEFAGIPKPQLMELLTPLLRETAKEPLDWDIVFQLWNVRYREAQYAALEYLKKHHRQLKPADLGNLKLLITNRSWWETVDKIDGFVGEVILKDRSLEKVMLEWAQSDNMWLRRVAIDFQQEYKLNTNAELLEEIICLNFGSSEFFINKAIGWSLREYAKVNADWVRGFIDRHRGELSPLSLREASKHL